MEKIELITPIVAGIASMVYILIKGKDYYKMFFENYNIPKAKYCNRKECGFHSRNYCANPQVAKRTFEKYSKPGNHAGCRLSFSRNKDIGEKAPTQAYVDRYIQSKNLLLSQEKWEGLSFVAFIILTVSSLGNLFISLIK